MESSTPQFSTAQLDAILAFVPILRDRGTRLVSGMRRRVHSPSGTHALREGDWIKSGFTAS